MSGKQELTIEQQLALLAREQAHITVETDAGELIAAGLGIPIEKVNSRQYIDFYLMNGLVEVSEQGDEILISLTDKARNAPQKRMIAESLGYAARTYGPGYVLFDPDGNLVGPTLEGVEGSIPLSGFAATPEQAWLHSLHYLPDFEEGIS